jgi:hypothetical protein
MTTHRLGLLALTALLAGCGTPRDVPPPPLESAHTSTGEVKVGRYFYATNDRITKRDINVYRVLYSETWVARRGPQLKDPFCRLAFPATAPTHDLAMGALLDRFAKHGFFRFPRRPAVHPDDILIPGRNTDALIVETDRMKAVIFRRDLAGAAMVNGFLKCVRDFEQLAEANRPVVVGVGVEKSNSFLYQLMQNPPEERAEEPKPTIKLKPAPFTPEARRRMQEEEEGKESPREKAPGGDAPTPPAEKPSPE